MPEQSDRPVAPRRARFSAMSFFWRLLFALTMVLVTYNPSGVSFFHWVREAAASGEVGAIHFFVGALLLVGWVILWVATWRALDLLGVVLVGLLIGTSVWLLIDLGLVDAQSGTAVAWIVILCLGILLGVGLSWSHVWRRLTGQYEVDTD